MTTAAGRRGASAATLTLCLLLGACTGDDAAEPAPAPTTTAPATAPSPVTVRGERRVTLEPLDPEGLFNADDPDGAPTPPDEDAARRFAAAVADWLDAHLTALNAGRDGRLDAVAPRDLPRARARAVLGRLASPADPVTTATYDIVVTTDGRPAWAHARVSLTRDGGGRELTLVLEPGPNTPVLVGAGAAAGGS